MHDIVDFPPLTADWKPPSDSLPVWGPAQKSHEECVLTTGPFKNLTGSSCYQSISAYLLNDEQLKKNGFPYFNGASQMAHINLTKYYHDNPQFVGLGTRQRTCCRCHTRYSLGPAFENPMATCVSHMRPTFDAQRARIVHPCCQRSPASLVGTRRSGCFSRNFHVFHHIFDSELFKFVRCPVSDGDGDFRKNSIYALDCEMVYTSHGPALARLSLVDVLGKTVMDVLVKPEGQIYDANTTFSGLTLQEVEQAEETLSTCREKLFQFVSRDSILIGHSLEADLKALRLVHEKIVDTSVLFIDRTRKKGLRILASRFLNRDIQQTQGHDSTEDAKTCLELVAYKLQVDKSTRDTNFNVL